MSKKNNDVIFYALGGLALLFLIGHLKTAVANYVVVPNWGGGLGSSRQPRYDPDYCYVKLDTNAANGKNMLVLTGTEEACAPDLHNRLYGWGAPDWHIIGRAHNKIYLGVVGEQ